MNEIIRELYTIEARAGQIMENTESQKKELQRKKSQQEEAVQKELELEAEGRLSILRSELEEQAQSEIQEMIQKNQRYMEALEQEFEGNYEKKAQEILARITEV